MKVCEHLLNLKVQKIANYFGKCQLTCTGNKNHYNSSLNICLSCGNTRCESFQNIQCAYQHSYGTKHQLVYRVDTLDLYCFPCQQNITQTVSQKQGIQISQNKFQKIVDAHNRVLEFAKKLHERLQERALLPDLQKKAEKPKKQKVNLLSVQPEKGIINQNYVKNEESIPKNKPNPKLQIFGLKNLGNTCFFNSTIQCLYATEILHSLYQSFIIDSNQQFGKIGQICLLFRKFLKNNQKCLNPKALFNWVCKSKGMYKHMDQQDAQQLLGVLLNGLIDGQKFWMGEEKVKMFDKKQKNTISERAFGFFLASRLECLQCSKISWSIDFSLEVAVSLTKTFNKKIPLPDGEVPKDEINEDGLVYPVFKESGCIIDTFFIPEYLGKDNFFTCEGCKSQKAFRKFYIKDPPAVLIMTLKRFNNNLSKNNADVKVVPFLDISGHCLNPGQHHYEIYAMIVHNGTARGGHYTACSKRGESWEYFSDTSFKPISWDKVRSCQPYILFYRRVAE